MSEHTPGPWEAVDCDGDLWEVDSKLHAICMISDHPPQFKANARLIAAAPRMLSQLERTRNAFYDLGEDMPHWAYVLGCEIMEVIREAKGETK